MKLKKKKNTQIYKILKISFTSFHILKSLYDSFTINVISYIIFQLRQPSNY